MLHYCLQNTKDLDNKNYLHLLAPIFIVLAIQDWKIRRKMDVRIIHRDSLCPKDPTTIALDTRCWEKSNLEVNQINLDEQESIFLIDHTYCSSPFTQVK